MTFQSRNHAIVCLALAGLALAALTLPVQAESAIRLRNSHVEYVLGPEGKSRHFIDRHTGIDYCSTNPCSSFANLKKGGREYPVTAVTYGDGILSARFDDAGATADISVTSKRHYFILEVKSVKGEDIDEFTFADITLTTKGTAGEPFAACAMALNLKTKVRELPGPSGRLRAMCYPRFGFTGARVAIIGCPQEKLRRIMKDVVGNAPDIPLSKVGGPWALDSPANYGSYLMTSGISEKDVDNWISVARNLGMRQIDFHGGRSFRFGDCEPDPKVYTNGFASFKAVIDKLHDAGILVGLHTYAFFIAKNCPWVTPVPDPRLGKDATFTLSEAIAPEAGVVPVEESTKDMSTVTGFFVRNSVTLQVDDELITYSDVSREPPFVFKGCKRGACGTRVAPHAKGAKVHHLRECFGLFVPDGDSTMLAEVAAKTAEMYNKCGFDMIYLDALDGEDVIAGRENGWHYGSKFTFEICRRLNKPAIMEMSTFHHHLWYVRSRMGAWDHPSRSHKKFIDVHCAANESCRRMFLPANLGWWSFKTWTGAMAEPTFADDIEYWCVKALANDSSIEIGVTPDSFNKTPAIPRLAGIVKQYEDLRLSKYFDEDVKQQLRVPGDEFTLVRDEKGKWRFRRVEYIKHKVEGLDGWSDAWSVTNRFAGQPLKLRIESLLSAGSYDAPGNITLADFNDISGFTNCAAEAGIRSKLESCADIVRTGTVSGRFTAASERKTCERSWAKAGKVFTPALNLARHQALGVWVHGDGKGEVLNLQLKSPPGFIPGDGDHYIIVDFTGWRYFELVEPEGERYANYSWPYGSLYSIYRENIAYSHVHALNLFYNNIPAKGMVACELSPVRALPAVKAKFRNPSVAIAGKTVVFPVEMESGSYLEFYSMSDCRLYGPSGELICSVQPCGDVPRLETGANAVRFSCEPPAGLNPRARISVVNYGD